MPYSLASAIRLEVFGSEVPFSHLDTACRLTPMLSATNSCVILQRVRFSLSISESDLRTIFTSSVSFGGFSRLRAMRQSR